MQGGTKDLTGLEVVTLVASLLIGASFILAGVSDWRKFAVKDTAWIPGLLGAGVWLWGFWMLSHSVGLVLFFLLLPAIMLLLGLGVRRFAGKTPQGQRRFGEADIIALVLLGVNPWAFGLSLSVTVILAMAALIRARGKKKSKVKIPYVAFLGVGYIVYLLLLVTGNV